MKNIIKWGSIAPEKICNILMGSFSIMHLIGSVFIGYYFSFIPTELEVLRNSTPTVIVDISNSVIWGIVSFLIFIIGILILRIILECVYIIISKGKR